MTYTLGNGPGTDMQVNGTLEISGNVALDGNGTIQVSSTATMRLKDRGVLAATTDNGGTMAVLNTATLSTATITNTGIFSVSAGNLYLNSGATLVNHSIFVLPATTSVTITSAQGTGTLINSALGAICKRSALGKIEIGAPITWVNHGLLQGEGECSVLSIITTNTGTLAPGNHSLAVLTVNPQAVTEKTPSFQLEIGTSGATPGVNHDQVVFSSTGAADITRARLTITDNAGDKVGTTYVLFHSPAGTITGPFAGITLPPTLGNLTYHANTVTVEKVRDHTHTETAARTTPAPQQ